MRARVSADWNGTYLINIDHHATARPFADVNWIDPSACATAEMIFRLAREAGVEISPEVATCLYTAVLTDTGSFCFNGTTERTFALAQDLVRCGADPVTIAHDVYFSTPVVQDAFAGRGAQHAAPRRQPGVDAREPRDDGTLRIAAKKIAKDWSTTRSLSRASRWHCSSASSPMDASA